MLFPMHGKALLGMPMNCVHWLQCLWCICLCGQCLSLVCLSLVCAVFTLIHIVYREHPNLSSHCTVSSTPSVPQGYRYCCDLSALHVWFVPDVIIWSALCILMFSGLVSWLKLLLCKARSLDSVILRTFNGTTIKSFGSYWIVLWPTNKSWWLSFLLCAQRRLWVLLGTLTPRWERKGPWSVGSTGARRKTFM